MLSVFFTKTTAESGSLILAQPWSMTTPGYTAAEGYQPVNSKILAGKTGITLSYDLHGSCVKEGDASALIFDQGGDWKFVSLSQYGQNCYNGPQSITIPLSDFSGLDPEAPLTGPFHVRFWSETPLTVDITSIEAVGTAIEPSVSPPPTPTPPAPLLPSQTEETPDNFSGLPQDHTVSGVIQVQYTADPATTLQVDFYIDNNYSESDTTAPYYLGGDQNGQPKGWNTQPIPDGTHELKAITVTHDRKLKTDITTFKIANRTSPTSASTSPTPTPIVSSIPSAFPHTSPPPSSSPWEIRSVDAMKYTKDAVCTQKDDTWISQWVKKAAELGANYVAISMPYDSPDCGNSVEYMKRWVRQIRAQGLRVWFRQMPLAFEAIYDTPKSNRTNYIDMINAYIKTNASSYQNGDIFTPIPEPQNGGIRNFTGCGENVCQFGDIARFNSWLRDATISTRTTFAALGKPGVKVGYYGFDGFVAWGNNNPDWNGVLEDETIKVMGNVTVDHYVEAVGGSMEEDLKELSDRYPGTEIIIGEWGTITGGNVEQQVKDTMGAASRNPLVTGFNYWHFGPGGAGEQLINDDFSNGKQFDEVQSFYRGQR